MIDYLEERLDSADALMEQIRRMELSLSGLTREEEQLEEPMAGVSRQGGEGREADTKTGSETGSQQEVDNSKRQVDQLEEPVYNRNAAARDRAGETEQSVNRVQQKRDEPDLAGNGPAFDEVQSSAEERSRPPLEVRLEELERAAATLSTAVPVGRGAAQIEGRTGGRGGYPLSLPSPLGQPAYSPVIGTPDQSQLAENAFASPGLIPGGELRWAEQADRAFRRDSRRYDGGFYLY